MALNTGRTNGKTGSRSRARIAVVAAVVLFLCLLAVLWGTRKQLKESKTVMQQKAGQVLVRKTGPGSTNALPAVDTAQAALEHQKRDTTKITPVMKQHHFATDSAVKAAAKAAAAKIAAADSAKVADSIKTAQAAADSLKVVDSIKAAQAAVDSARAAKKADTEAVDSEAMLFGANAPADCENDTVVPWVYPEPSGGLYHGPLTIRFT